jgi:hypothetical protein
LIGGHWRCLRGLGNTTAIEVVTRAIELYSLGWALRRGVAVFIRRRMRTGRVYA